MMPIIAAVVVVCAVALVAGHQLRRQSEHYPEKPLSADQAVKEFMRELREKGL